MSEFTIETLEKMFVYLGCANVDTQDGMDGAIPIESMRAQGDYLAEFDVKKIPAMPSDWNTKAIWFQGDALAMSTVDNVHWSVLAPTVSRTWRMMQATSRAVGERLNMKYPDSEGFIRLHYSQVGIDGKFKKFRITPRRYHSLLVTRVYNPTWLLSIHNDYMKFVTSDGDDLFERLRLSFITNFLCGIAQSTGSYWQVKTKFDEVCPALTLLTDPIGVKEFWKLRDIPAGAKRRSALLHWVGDHWRKSRRDPDVETYVRKHLRGETEITHGNFMASITPSTKDTVDNEIAKRERDDMRKLKSDRRKRRARLVK